MSHFHNLRISEVRKETTDCVSVAFEVPAGLTDKFQFKPGQNITLRAQIEGEEVRRSYSLCSTPHKNEWRVAIKRTPGGVFSTWANSHLKAGDFIEVMPPTGRFFLSLDANHRKHYVGIAAGSGITPLLSMITSVLELEPESRFSLLYGNKSLHSIIFKEQLEQLKNKYLGRFQMWNILSREKTDAPLFYGRIDVEKCTTIFTKILPIANIDSFYLCGPQELTFTTKDTLIDLGVPAKQIHFELFGSAGAVKSGVVRPPLAPTLAEQMSQLTIRMDGVSFKYELPYGGVSILDAATAAGADVPFSCKGGVCATCKAKLVHGEVEMLLNYALEPDEVAAGYILTCQSHPRSPEVEVDFEE